MSVTILFHFVVLQSNDMSFCRIHLGDRPIQVGDVCVCVRVCVRMHVCALMCVTHISLTRIRSVSHMEACQKSHNIHISYGTLLYLY